MRRTVKRVIRFFRPVYWPLVKTYFLYLSPETKGVRVVLTYKDEILFIKNSYGLKYNFPGGNLRKCEDPEQGAKREVKEEIGIDIKELRLLGTIVPPLKYEYRKNTISIFVAELPSEEVNINNLEIEESIWCTKGNPPPLGPVAKMILDMYQTKS